MRTLVTHVCRGNQHLHDTIDAQVSTENVESPQGHANLVRICGVASSFGLTVFFRFFADRVVFVPSVWWFLSPGVEQEKG